MTQLGWLYDEVQNTWGVSEIEGGGSLPINIYAGVGNPNTNSVVGTIGDLYSETEGGGLFFCYSGDGESPGSWVGVAGNTDNETPTAGVLSRNNAELVAKVGFSAWLTDTAADFGTGNGLKWHAISDGAQELTCKTGPNGEFIRTLQSAEGFSTIVPPNSDPLIEGAIWNDSGVLAISEGT